MQGDATGARAETGARPGGGRSVPAGARVEADGRGTRADEERVLALLRERESFLLTGHVRPDGDCLGAQAALAGLLGALGKRVVILNPDPPEPRYAYLARELDFGAFRGGALPAHEVVVLLDGGDLSRTGLLEAPLRAAPSRKVVIDHHVPSDAPWWDAAWLDSSAAATGLLVRRIAKELGVRLGRSAALGVMTSIVTDTGWFRYSNTDAETLTVAAEMIALGVEPAELFRELYQRRGAAHPRFLARLLESVEYLAEGRLAVIREPLAGSLRDPDVDSDEALDVLRSVGSVEVVVYLREMPDGACKLSARSKGAYDVHALAARFGGGGHRKAAGATLPGPLAAAGAVVVSAALAAFEPLGRAEDASASG